MFSVAVLGDRGNGMWLVSFCARGSDVRLAEIKFQQTVFPKIFHNLVSGNGRFSFDAQP
jgi:hypothetical protein